jgi:hypothetical protein
MADAQLDIVLSAKDMSQQAFASLNNSVKGLGGSLDFLKNAFAGLATGYGSLRAIGQAIESAKLGSALEKQATAFNNLSEAAGTSSKRMLESLKAVSGRLVAEADLMSSAGKALLMSIPADKITELMKIAAATSKMTGQTITEAFGDITMGVARQSRMILDNLGIIVDVDKANQDYARSLGKTSDALTDAERRQAFMNAVMKSGDDMIKRLGSSQNELEGTNKALAGQKNLWDEISKSTASFLDGPLTAYGGIVDAITAKLKDLRESGSSSDRNEESFLINQNRMYERLGLRAAGSTSSMQAKFNARWVGTSEAELAAQRSHQEWQKPDWMAGWREREGNFAANTEEQNRAILKDREEFLKKLADEAKKAKEEVKKLADEIGKLGQEFQDSKIFSGESSNYERMQAQLRSGSQLSDMEQRRIETESDAWAKEALSWNQNMMDRVAEYEKTQRKLTDLTEATAEAMQSNFSNLFFDAMTGELKSLEDYATAVFHSIARMISDLASQQLTRGMFGPNMQGGGWLSDLAKLFGGGAANLPINTPGAFAAAQPFHSGGSVDGSGPWREIPAWMIATAPRLHGGLAPDEFPAVLQRGETVIPKKGQPQIINHITVQAPNGRMDRESLSQLQSSLYATMMRSFSRNG